MVSRGIEKTGLTDRDVEILYKAVVQMLLLYRSNSWVIT